MTFISFANFLSNFGIENPRGKSAVDFMNDPLAEKYIDITYARRGTLGKILPGSRTTKKIKVPQGYRLLAVENNKPSVGKVKITLGAIRRRVKRANSKPKYQGSRRRY